MLIDGEQREQATDPGHSFIVQAPAGSGKTEILTQRYLRLLGTVSAPEQIIALTFTRKAASEMRERIVRALQQAAQGQKANNAHQQKTLDFAHEALQCDARHQWNLLHQPNRLKVITIDSLCQSINQAIPLLEKQIAFSKITEKAASHYLNASRRCLQFALENDAYQDALKTLLLHVDNRQDRLLNLFASLLAQRDQWLSPLFQAMAQEKSCFEQALRLIEEHELNRFKQSLPFPLALTLTECARELALIENNPDSPRYSLKDWYDFQQTDVKTAAALSKLLLTAEGSCRKSFDHHVGLSSNSCPAAQYKKLKNASKELLSTLSEYPDFVEALVQVSNLPAPEYHPEQWEVLKALFLLLPLLAGHLQVLFSEENEVDFTAISQQALAALGDHDSPTDLALYLDNAIHHLLVDEFQDTSLSQFDLLSKLVHGWQEGDGKTLFIVGDPMQSIYRFRQAEVGLFFRAKFHGIGPVSLKPLELRCNFRSTKSIVDWVNQQFIKIFPATVDIEAGAVSYHPSTSIIESSIPSSIQALHFKDKQQEALALLQLIQQEMQAHPERNMAILVRSRTQLSEIVHLLRLHHIPYQGTDIALLANLPHLQDVWSLTQALLCPANRLAWLALLRSPYCGLSLHDVHAIAQWDRKKSIYAALLQLTQIQGLSAEGLVRARFFIHIMRESLAHRYEMKLSNWVIHTMKALHSEHILSPAQLDDLEQFWSLLDRYEQDGRLSDTSELIQNLNQLYSKQVTPARLQVMTIHKSKGLEFDIVFLPGLSAQANKGDAPILRWLNLPTTSHGNLLLMSPIQAAHQERCAVYDYLSHWDDIKDYYETQRLLYVAVTRAKIKLYLMDYAERTPKNSFRALLKHQEFAESPTAIAAEKESGAVLKRFILPLHFYEQDRVPIETYPKPPLMLTPGHARLTGIVTHQLLQWVCEHHPTTLSEVPWDLALYEFKKLGFNELMQQEALRGLRDHIARLFADETGLWIISAHHNEHTEYELLVKQHNKIVTRIIDRMFEYQERLWIVDFKTGKEDDQALAKHQQQLNEYGFHLSARTPLPIHCGIYYLSSNHWVHWQYESIPVMA